MLDLFQEFVLEVVRALLVEELSARARRQVMRMLERRVRRRHSWRVVHILRTDRRRDL
jgi:hypothetical protein